jgi:hypothetical protein
MPLIAEKGFGLKSERGGLPRIGPGLLEFVVPDVAPLEEDRFILEDERVD